MEKKKQIRIFDRQANDYLNKQEDPRQKQWRQNLISHAKGEVLEIAVGAGANFKYYHPDVKVTATDFSEVMIEKAVKAAKSNKIEVDFQCIDVEAMNFPDHSFDTIVSTLSLCSYDNPLMVLDKINRWCRPNGKILLMEHGISTNIVVSVLQKTFDPLMYRIYGCHYNRNIIGMIRESGINIEKVESHFFNMVHLIRAKPSQ